MTKTLELYTTYEGNSQWPHDERPATEDEQKKAQGAWNRELKWVYDHLITGKFMTMKKLGDFSDENRYHWMPLPEEMKQHIILCTEGPKNGTEMASENRYIGAALKQWVWVIRMFNVKVGELLRLQQLAHMETTGYGICVAWDAGKICRAGKKCKHLHVGPTNAGNEKHRKP